MEIEKFRFQHEAIVAHQEATRVQREARQKLRVEQQAYFDRKLEEYDLEVQQQADWAEWNWSPLYRLVCPARFGPPAILVSYTHDDEEFDMVMQWVRQQVESLLAKAQCPAICAALKFF